MTHSARPFPSRVNYRSCEPKPHVDECRVHTNCTREDVCENINVHNCVRFQFNCTIVYNYNGHNFLRMGGGERADVNVAKFLKITIISHSSTV